MEWLVLIGVKCLACNHIVMSGVLDLSTGQKQFDVPDECNFCLAPTNMQIIAGISGYPEGIPDK